MSDLNMPCQTVSDLAEALLFEPSNGHKLRNTNCKVN